MESEQSSEVLTQILTSKAVRISSTYQIFIQSNKIWSLTNKHNAISPLISFSKGRSFPRI